MSIQNLNTFGEFNLVQCELVNLFSYQQNGSWFRVYFNIYLTVAAISRLRSEQLQ
jgi:hypothetical protein